jgi:hypothetical protein
VIHIFAAGTSQDANLFSDRKSNRRFGGGLLRI